MNSIQTPIAIRTTAAALAVFMTVATLNTLFVETQHSVLLAQAAARAAARAASAPLLVQLLAQAPIGEIEIEIGH